jgi:hypothetical protein
MYFTPKQSERLRDALIEQRGADEGHDIGDADSADVAMCAYVSLAMQDVVDAVLRAKGWGEDKRERVTQYVVQLVQQDVEHMRGAM